TASKDRPIRFSNPAQVVAQNEKGLRVIAGLFLLSFRRWSPNPFAGPIYVAPLLLLILPDVHSRYAAKERRGKGKVPQDDLLSRLIDKEPFIAIVDRRQRFCELVDRQVLGRDDDL